MPATTAIKAWSHGCDRRYPSIGGICRADDPQNAMIDDALGRCSDALLSSKFLIENNGLLLLAAWLGSIANDEGIDSETPEVRAERESRRCDAT